MMTTKTAQHPGTLEDTAEAVLAPQSAGLAATSFRHPRDILANDWVRPERKRELLAHWASDIHAVPDHPSLRRLENGAVALIDDLLEALKSLDRPIAVSDRPAAERRRPKSDRLLHRLRRGATRLRRRRDDDDDPPPAPAAAARPVPPGFGGASAAVGAI